MAATFSSQRSAEAYALARAGRFAEARECFYRLLRDKPANAERLLALGVCCHECNAIDEAIAHTLASLALAPDNARANVHLGICCLLLGDAIPGWRGLSHRKRLSPLPMPSPPPVPAWQGEPLEGRGIVLIREQGLGDVLQFVRYAPLVNARGGSVYLDVPPPLRRLLATEPRFGTVLGSGQPAEIQRHAYFMDLPGLLGEHPQHPTCSAPYLPCGDAVPAGSALRIGLAWGGNPDNVRDPVRSIPLAAFAPLLEIPDCLFSSVLVGPRVEDIAQAGLQDRITDLSGKIGDFMDLASVIRDLDLVITVDTAVAHLAGAMGKSAWVLLSTPSDWRWGTSGSTTDWYPSMRLFRQSEPGDWTSVIASLVHALEDLRANRS